MLNAINAAKGNGLMNDLYTGRLTGTLPSNLTNMDYVCNGFSIKDTILEVLMDHAELDWFSRSIAKQDVINLSQCITDALAIKLRLKQG